MTNEQCAVCAAAAVSEKAVTETVKRGRKTVHYSQYISVCGECGFESMDASQINRSRKALVAAERELIDAPLPGDIRAWRRRWGIRQDDAGKMLRVGPTAFSKYENSTLLPSGPTCQLLKLLLSSSVATERLAEMSGVRLQADYKLFDVADKTETLKDKEVLFQGDIGGRACVMVAIPPQGMRNGAIVQKLEDADDRTATVPV